MNVPALQEVVDRLAAIVQGTETRESVANWADQWVLRLDPSVEDSQVWGLLGFAAAVDLRQNAIEYQYSDADILAEIDRAS